MENIPSTFYPLSGDPLGEQEANGWGEPGDRENRPSSLALRAMHTLVLCRLGRIFHTGFVTRMKTIIWMKWKRMKWS